MKDVMHVKHAKRHFEAGNIDRAHRHLLRSYEIQSQAFGGNENAKEQIQHMFKEMSNEMSEKHTVLHTEEEFVSMTGDDFQITKKHPKAAPELFAKINGLMLSIFTQERQFVVCNSFECSNAVSAKMNNKLITFHRTQYISNLDKQRILTIKATGIIQLKRSNVMVLDAHNQPLLWGKSNFAFVVPTLWKFYTNKDYKGKHVFKIKKKGFAIFGNDAYRATINEEGWNLLFVSMMIVAIDKMYLDRRKSGGQQLLQVASTGSY